MRTIEISDEIFEAATRTAAIDHLDVRTLVESLVRRHTEYVEIFNNDTPDAAPFSLDYYEMDRAADETDEDYQKQLEMFTSL